MSKDTDNSRSDSSRVERRVTQQKIARVTNGILKTITDSLLFHLFFFSEYASSFDRRAIEQSLRLAHEDLYDVNYQRIKNTLYNLKRRGLIASLKLGVYEEIMTKKGRQRIEQLIPVYQEKRPWDKRVYLVTYDIPEKVKKKRDSLRNFLKGIGCASLQRSTWLTVYNPKTLIQEFIEENNIPGQILVSDLGQDGSVGEEDLKELINRIYNLDVINEEYEIFLFEFKDYKDLGKKKKRKAIFKFISVLRKDPQLPFELLPPDWRGDEAYLFYEKLLKANFS